MPKIIAIITLFYIGISQAAASYIPKIGDILLQDLECWSCHLIEAQENSMYSHMGVIIENGKKIKVLEALGSVHALSLEKFMKRNLGVGRVKVLRFENLNNKQRDALSSLGQSLIGASYDKEFLWSNVENTHEKYYCSELVYKMFKNLGKDLGFVPNTMPFDINPDGWDSYFNHKTPRGEIGVSPEDFNKSPKLRWIQTL